MADRKEVLDYLRNQQKAAEIEAKMNGVNVWVLLGAIAVVGWQLTSAPASMLWSNYELTVRVLVAAGALHMLSWVIGKSGGARDELRYSRGNSYELDSPFLVLLRGLLLLVPSVALWVLSGPRVGAIALGFFGLSFMILSSLGILNNLIPPQKKGEKFPKPEFRPTRRASATFELLTWQLNKEFTIISA